jgi:signal transduction histidine kinase
MQRMGPTLRSFLARYGFAVLAVSVALVIRLLLDPVLGDGIPFMLSCLAVIAVAWYGGFGPSFLALILAILSVAYFVLPPRYSPGQSLAAHRPQVVGFIFLGVTIAVFSEGLQRARRRAEEHARQADRKRAELEQEIALREQLEVELARRASELALADRRKDEFLAMLGHELRNPLAPIANAVHVMRMLGVENPQLCWARDVIDRQVGQMVRLLGDLLDVSRISRGKITLKKESVELSAVVGIAVESSRPLLEARRHELTLEMPSEAVWLQADLARLAQVVANLLNNAGKYTEKGGRIGLTAERQGDEVVLRVADNGTGIAPEMLPRVFDLFSQSERTLDRSDGGLGIGLTLVKSLVELHEGSIEAFSEGLGKGSDFVVRLPVLRLALVPSANGIRQIIPPGTTARRVLAVDDNVDAVESLARMLGLQGHEVRTAHDGPAALAAAAAFLPEVVFLDIGLPNMNGYEVARRLREQVGLKTALLVAVTGYGQAEDRRQADEAGFDAHLVKPTNQAALQALLARRIA